MTSLTSKFRLRTFFALLVLLSYFFSWPGTVTGWGWPARFMESAPGYWALVFLLFYLPPVFIVLGLGADLRKRPLRWSAFRWYKWGSIGALLILIFFSDAFINMGPDFFHHYGLTGAVAGYLGLFIFKGRSI